MSRRIVAENANVASGKVNCILHSDYILPGVLYLAYVDCIFAKTSNHQYLSIGGQPDVLMNPRRTILIYGDNRNRVADHLGQSINSRF